MRGRHYLLIGFLVGIIVYGFVSAVLSYQSLQCPRDEQYESQGAPSHDALKTAPAVQKKTDSGEEHVEKHPKRIKAVCGVLGFFPSAVALMNDNEGFFVGLFTGLLVFVTGVLVWATMKLWNATIQADRPWVGTVTVGPDRERNPLAAEIVIRNTGRSPALQMRVAHRGVLLEQGAIPVIPDLRNEVPKALFPHADDFYYPLHGRAPFTAAEREGFETGTHVLWLIARVEYLDGWGRPHHTNICTRWDHGRGTFVPDLQNNAD